MSDGQLLQPAIWQRLTGAAVRLPHALLFAGDEGMGKRLLAESLAQRLLCEASLAPAALACGECASCRLFAAGTHPDYRLVQPEAEEGGAGGNAEAGEGSEAPAGEKKKASTQIRIGQIRALETFFYIGSHRGGARICLIDPAESMNAVTANALLKILEEPADAFYFILISHRWHQLLPTLVSRARRVHFSPPERSQAQAWLAVQRLDKLADWLPFFGHAPLALAQLQQRGQLKALEQLVSDLLAPQPAIAQAARWESHVKADGALGMDMLVTSVQKWAVDLGLVACGAPPRYLPHRQAALAALTQRLSLPLLLQSQKQLAQMRRLARHPLNARLFLEELCMRAFKPLNL